MGLPRDYDPNTHKPGPPPPKGGESFELTLDGRPWARVSLDARVHPQVSLSYPHPRDPWTTLPLFAVTAGAGGELHYQLHIREEATRPEVSRSVSLTPRPGQRIELRDATARPWGVVEIAGAVRLHDPAGRLRACITTTPGPLALQCWDERGEEVAGRVFLRV